MITVVSRCLMPSANFLIRDVFHAKQFEKEENNIWSAVFDRDRFDPR